MAGQGARKRALNVKQSERQRPRRSRSSKVGSELCGKPPHESINGVETGVHARHITGPPARTLRLLFKTNPPSKTFSKSNLQDEHGGALGVILIDKATGQTVTNGPESRAKLEVVPLTGDFRTSEEQEWSAEEFEKHVAIPRENRAPLLCGDLKVYLKDGEGTLGQMSFKDNSSFTRSKTFRLGIRVAPDNQHGLMSIQEGKSSEISVLDIRGKAYEKHPTPSATDEVWRLDNIGKNGPIHAKLSRHGIKTVNDFLVWLETRPELLKTVCTMSERVYRATVEHAKKCVLGDKLYNYCVEQPLYPGVIFNANDQVAGAVVQRRFVHLDMIDSIDKTHFDSLVRSAHHRWGTDVQECAKEDLSKLFMFEPEGKIDGSFAEDRVNVAAENMEDAATAVYASFDTEGILPLQRISWNVDAPESEGGIDGWFGEDTVDIAAEDPVTVAAEDMDTVDIAARLQGAVHASLGTEGVLPLQPITREGNVDGEEWGELLDGTDLHDWMEDMCRTPEEVAPVVKCQQLRLRIVIWCAYFLRRAAKRLSVEKRVMKSHPKVFSNIQYIL